ncbi:heme peroxidase family protein [Terrabacter sp. Soil810]|uniref:peroxidase family protein n=1 Tax=Terrabacter sp. Soil810 TaxID=1736418 RepID=UPI00070A4AB6|nr:heme peroxidase family protein [Terrabacter sp. Soil810]KRF46214.1 hypothetical protein ASG96_21585 [Terrabacter sp. Soil810]
MATTSNGPRPDQGSSEQPAAANVPKAVADVGLDVPSQPFLDQQLHGQTTRTTKRSMRTKDDTGPASTNTSDPVAETTDPAHVHASVQALAARIEPEAPVPLATLPDEIRQSVTALQPGRRSTHGSKYSLAYFPGPQVRRPCGDRFGYLTTARTRSATRLPFTAANRGLLTALGTAMAAPGRDAPIADSTIDAGMTYAGQFIDHDITLDVSSSLDISTDANTIHNMRSPSLDLDSVYGRGPALDPFLYDMPGPGANPSAIKMQLGTNLPSGPGGPGGPGGSVGMVQHADRDVPRLLGSAHTAIIGDPRNDENLVVVQLHHTMLRFHNAVVDAVLASGFSGDVFVEAKRIVTHHYQWAVVHDFLRAVCGPTAVTSAMTSVSAPPNSAFRMPVEFSVAAYRFGHSMIRDTYWLNFNFPAGTLAQVFQFNRNPHLPVRSNWVVDLNAFFPTGIPVPVFNKARKIDTGIAAGLEHLPGFTGMMEMLAVRNLLRGLALGLPSGQGVARAFGITPLTAAQLTAGLPAPEQAALSAAGGVLLTRTPLWYYVLREAAVLKGGNRLGPVGARIVAETFARMLKRDPDSFVNQLGGFVPILPGASAGAFTFADLVTFTRMNLP